MPGMRRREFITLLGGAAVAWPLAAWAQGERMRRIGVLLGSTAPDRPDVAGFLQALQQLGWSEGHNLRIDYRWGRGNAADTHKYAQELVALAPDVLLVSGASSLTPLLRRRARCRSCLPASPIRSVPASSRACRGRAATPPALFSSSTA